MLQTSIILVSSSNLAHVRNWPYGNSSTPLSFVRSIAHDHSCIGGNPGIIPETMNSHMVTPAVTGHKRCGCFKLIT